MAVSWRGYRPRSIGFPPRTLFVIVSPSWIVIPHDRFPRQGDPPPVLDRWLIISTGGWGKGKFFWKEIVIGKKRETHYRKDGGGVWNGVMKSEIL